MEDRWLFILPTSKDVYFWAGNKRLIQASTGHYKPFSWHESSVPYIEKALKGKVLAPSSLVTWGKENE